LSRVKMYQEFVDPRFMEELVFPSFFWIYCMCILPVTNIVSINKISVVTGTKIWM